MRRSLRYATAYAAATQRPEEDDSPVTECLRSKRIETTVPKLRLPASAETESQFLKDNIAVTE